MDSLKREHEEEEERTEAFLREYPEIFSERPTKLKTLTIELLESLSKLQVSLRQLKEEYSYLQQSTKEDLEQIHALLTEMWRQFHLIK